MLPQNFVDAVGTESAEIAAQKAGFGNKETYRQAKKNRHAFTQRLLVIRIDLSSGCFR